MKNQKSANIFKGFSKKEFFDIQKDELTNIDFCIQEQDLIFLYGDLGMGKTTLSKYIINTYIGENIEVTSPTYVYYNNYNNLYHFDLYRIDSYETFTQIGGEDIIDNRKGPVLIEWPELLETYFLPDIIIHITAGSSIDKRNIEIKYITPRYP